MTAIASFDSLTTGAGECNVRGVGSRQDFAFKLTRDWKIILYIGYKLLRNAIKPQSVSI